MINKKQLILLNRQPTLFRHGCPAIIAEASDDDSDNTITISPLALEPLGGDFDGDTVALTVIHDAEAIEELYERAFLRQTICYDQNNNFLATIRHEAMYAIFLMTDTLDINTEPVGYIENLQALPEDIDIYNKLSTIIQFNNKNYTYGILLLNKWCGFNEVIINERLNSKKTNYLSQIIYENVNRNKELFYERLTELEKKLFFFISVLNDSPTINLSEIYNVFDKNTLDLFKKLPNKHIQLGYHINEALVQRCLEQMSSTSLYKLLRSGSRIKQDQINRGVINIGYIANAENTILLSPIKTSILEGLDEYDFFRSAFGSRKGISDKANFTPDSGYIERTITMGLSILKIAEYDCGDKDGLEIIVSSSTHAETLIDKYYKDKRTDKQWKVITIDGYKNLINKTIFIRSPITCNTNNFAMCQMCFGEKDIPTKENIGIVAGQCIMERFTQLIMRTFHTSGNANITTNDEIIAFLKENLIDIIEKDKQIRLRFNKMPPPYLLTPINGFIEIDPIDCAAIFDQISDRLMNRDAISMLDKIRSILKKQTSEIKSPAEYYSSIMGIILSMGTIYSSFIEMVFANMFMTDEKNKEFWRYNKHKKITTKLGDKILAKNISPMLYLLYTPNRNSIATAPLSTDVTSNEMETIYEKLWNNTI